MSVLLISFRPGIGGLHDTRVAETLREGLPAGSCSLNAPIRASCCNDAKRILRIRHQEPALEDSGSAGDGSRGQHAVERIRNRGQQVVAHRKILVGNLIQLQTGTGVRRRNNQVRSFRSRIGKTRRRATAQGPLHRHVPLLRVTERLVRNARPDAASQQVIHTHLGMAEGGSDSVWKRVCDRSPDGLTGGVLVGRGRSA